MWSRQLFLRAGRTVTGISGGVVELFEALSYHMKPTQLLLLGFLSYVLLGLALLSLPWAQSESVGVVDNLFSVTSAISTTGLTTVSVSDSYSFFGEFVVMCLFQLGGVGYMTLSSFVVLARGQSLSGTRLGILRTQFALPKELNIRHFVRDLVVFATFIEVVGAALLYVEFRAAGVENALWSAVFHCVSAFATAGFSLNNNSLEAFRDNGVVCGTIGALSYLGAIGFIVIQDVWRTARRRQQRISFTSKVILTVTSGIFIVGTPVLYFADESLRSLAPLDRFYAATFQVMTASSTAGFNTVPIHQMGAAALTLTMIIMVIGASPSGTGGGAKTTTLSALFAVLVTMLRGRTTVLLFGHELPTPRILAATASATLYLFCLSAGIFILCLIESHTFLELVFEATSALGTVGLSLGITGNLTAAGKLTIVLLMFVGRVGPLTMGLALIRRTDYPAVRRLADLAV
jgi:trk system potassium uptake protein TrkH